MFYTFSWKLFQPQLLLDDLYGSRMELEESYPVMGLTPLEVE